MKRVILSCVSLTILLLLCVPASAERGRAERRGGGVSHREASATTHTNAAGGSTTRYQAGGTAAAGHYGSAAFSGNYDHYYGGSYNSYHPPVTVNHYAATGCYNCGGWATAGAAATGVAVGLTAGAVAASAHNSAAASNAYTQGYAAGASQTAYGMGEIVAALPGGCATPNIEGRTYYLCGNTWFSPSYGANGIYYRVVPAP